MHLLSIRILAAALGALALAGCGSSARGPVHATLVLDFVPNSVHAGVYRALAAGYYGSAGIDLQVVPPSSTSTTLELVEAGKAQFGLADGIDVAEQIAMGRDAKAIMAVDFAGQPCRLDELRALADRHGLFLLEDAAHSAG